MLQATAIMMNAAGPSLAGGQTRQGKRVCDLTRSKPPEAAARLS
jgi:hypothetical protein